MIFLSIAATQYVSVTYVEDLFFTYRFLIYKFIFKTKMMAIKNYFVLDTKKPQVGLSTIVIFSNPLPQKKNKVESTSLIDMDILINEIEKKECL